MRSFRSHRQEETVRGHLFLSALCYMARSSSVTEEGDGGETSLAKPFTLQEKEKLLPYG